MKVISHNFELDEKYLCSVSITKTWSMYANKKELTEDELVNVLKGTDLVSSTHSEDHPKFAEFRNNIEEMGFIRAVRNCWNGDTVISPFTLNGVKFLKGDKFPCAAAIKVHLEIKRKYGKF